MVGEIIVCWFRDSEVEDGLKGNVEGSELCRSKVLRKVVFLECFFMIEWSICCKF